MDNIIKENHNRYADGLIVDEYMKESYHQLRIQQVYELINEELSIHCSSIPINEIQFLEIAGSTGTVSQQMSRMGMSVTLSDIEMNPLQIASKNNPQIKTILMDASKPFPFKDDTFNILYAGDIIEHLYDTQLFLSECRRCLKPNGLLVLTTPNLATLQDRINFVFGKSPRQIDPNHEFLKLHIRPFTYSMLKKCLIINQFDDFKLRTNFVRLRIYHCTFDSKIMGKLFPALGRVLVVSAHKQE